MKKRLEEILNLKISRRDTVTTAAKIGSAVALSNAITLPFSSTALAADVPAGKESAETVRHSACLVNCGSRCALKVIVKDDRIVRIEPEDAKDVRYLANTKSGHACAVAQAAGGFTARIALNIR